MREKTEEDYLLERIAEIQRAYQKQIDVYVKRLIEIKSRETHSFYVTQERFEAIRRLHKGGLKS